MVAKHFGVAYVLLNSNVSKIRGTFQRRRKLEVPVTLVLGKGRSGTVIEIYRHRQCRLSLFYTNSCGVISHINKNSKLDNTILTNTLHCGIKVIGPNYLRPSPCLTCEFYSHVSGKQIFLKCVNWILQF